MDAAYVDKLDGKISEEFWEREAGEWRLEEQRVKRALDDLVPTQTPGACKPTVVIAYQFDRTEGQRDAQHENLVVDFSRVELFPERRVRIAKASIEGFFVDDLSVVLDPKNGPEFIRHGDSTNSRKAK